MQFKSLIPPLAVTLVVAACGASDPTAPALDELDDPVEAQVGHDAHDKGATPLHPDEPVEGPCVKVVPGSQLGEMIITKPAKDDGTCPGGFTGGEPQPG
ncbi:MAG: hypothetical protein KY466_09370 [Gemmatimonadetes bacterium]|nr:hypothetical protein [Gemmatimonadota bacterium]